jgi:hypothetical protein
MTRPKHLRTQHDRTNKTPRELFEKRQEEYWARKASQVETRTVSREEIETRRKNTRATSPFRKGDRES